MPADIPALRGLGGSKWNPGTARWRPRVVARTGGSGWLSALPTGSSWNRALPGSQTSVGVWGSAKRSGASPSSRRQSAGKPADSKTLAASIYGGWVRVLSGGSNRQSALPTGGSKWLSALPTGSKWSRALPGKEVTGLCNKMAESAIAEQGKC